MCLKNQITFTNAPDHLGEIPDEVLASPAARGLSRREVLRLQQEMVPPIHRGNRIRWARVTPLNRENWEQALPMPKKEVVQPPKERKPRLTWVKKAGIFVPHCLVDELARQEGERLRKWRQRLRQARNSWYNASQARQAELVKDKPIVQLLRAAGSAPNKYEKLGLASQQKYIDAVEQQNLEGVKTSFFSNCRWRQSPEQKQARALAKEEERKRKVQRTFYLEEQAILKNSLYQLAQARVARKIVTDKWSVNKYSHVLTWFNFSFPSMSPPFSPFSFRPRLVPDGQMESEKTAHGEASPQSIESVSNTVLQDNRESSEAQASQSVINAYEVLAAPSDRSAPESWSRVMRLAEFQWTATSTGMIWSFDFFDKLFEDRNIRSTPTMMAFMQYAFFAGDLKIEFKVNSNVRQYGQLQACFYYGANYDAYFYKRNNIYTCSQMPHILLSASSSNSGTLHVPFEFVNPYMSSFKRTGSQTLRQQCHLGKCFVNVLSPLVVASTTVKYCYVTVFISFANCRFAGLIDRTLVEGQMISVVKELGKMALDNMDQPTVNQVGNVIIPQNTSSWAAGTAQASYQNVLRLNPNCILSYEQGRTPTGVDMTVDSIKSVFGLLCLIDWTAQDQVGKQLWSMTASPILPDAEYTQSEVGGVRCLYYPPLAIVASLAAFWKGPIDIRFDIIGSTELTGRLYVCYVPNYLENTLTWDQSRSFASATFDLQDNNQFIFQVPYLTDMVMRRRPFEFSTDEEVNEAPGRVFLFVLNPLIANATIPDSCKIAIYVRGGDGFEIAVPAPPSIGLCFNTDIIYPPGGQTLTVTSKEGYYPVYTGEWRFFRTSRNESAVILRYGEVSDHIAQFYCNDSFSKLVNKVLTFKNNSGQIQYYSNKECTSLVNLNQFIPFRMLAYYPSGEYIFMICPRSGKERDVAKLVASDEEGKLSSYESIADLCLPYYCAGPWCKPSRLEFVPIAGGQMDERQNNEAPVIIPTGSGASGMSRILGETFTDLKDFCRRYQIYAKGSFNINKSSDNVDNLVQITFPVIPQGLNLDLGDPTNINEVFNRYRDGLIPVIASGFRFFSGGIRFRVILIPDAGSTKHARYYVSHQPSATVTDLSVRVVNTSRVGSADFECPGFAFHVQCHLTNAIISFEVPFYKEFVRTFLQRPVMNKFVLSATSLGNVQVSVDVNSLLTKSMRYEIYYSLADDSTFSVFQGFPPVFKLTNIQSRKIPIPKPPTIDEIKDEPDRVTHDDLRSIKDSVKFNEDNITEVKNEVAALDKLTSKFDKQIYTVQTFVNKNTDAIKKGEVTVQEIGRRQNLINTRLRFSEWIEPKSLNEAKQLILAKPKGQMFKCLEGLAAMPQLSKDAQKLTEKFENVNSKDISKIVEKVKEFPAQECAEAMIGVTEIVNYIKQMLGSFAGASETASHVLSSFETWTPLIVNLTSQITHCIEHPSPITIANAAVTMAVNLGLIGFQAISSLVKSLIRVLKGLFSTNEHRRGGPSGQGEGDDPKLGYVSMLLGAISTIIKCPYKCSEKTLKGFSKLIFGNFDCFSTSSTKILNFFKSHLDTIRHMYHWLINKHPLIKDIAFLEQYSVEIYQWAVDVQDLTDARNELKVLSSAALATRVFLRANQASVLQIKLLNDKIDPQQMQILNKLIADIIKLRDRLARLYICPPIRYEPFTVYCYGASRIGKTNALQVALEECLTAIDYRTYGEITYVRNVGNAYWNGLTNQPICYYDDFYCMSTPEMGDVQIAEIMQLKSRAVFNPPKAMAEEKEIRYNPLILGINSNMAFPAVIGANHPDALYNRRDVLVHARLNPQYAGQDVQSLPKDVKERMDHIQFAFHPHVNNDQAKQPPPEDAYVSYHRFVEVLKNKFREYHENESEIYSRLLRRATRFYPKDDEDEFKFDTHIHWEALDQMYSKLDISTLHLRERVKEISNLNSPKEFIQQYARKFREWWNCVFKNKMSLDYSPVPKTDKNVGTSDDEDRNDDDDPRGQISERPDSPASSVGSWIEQFDDKVPHIFEIPLPMYNRVIKAEKPFLGYTIDGVPVYGNSNDVDLKDLDIELDPNFEIPLPYCTVTVRGEIIESEQIRDRIELDDDRWVSCPDMYTLGYPDSEGKQFWERQFNCCHEFLEWILINDPGRVNYNKIKQQYSVKVSLDWKISPEEFVSMLGGGAEWLADEMDYVSVSGFSFNIPFFELRIPDKKCIITDRMCQECSLTPITKHSLAVLYVESSAHIMSLKKQGLDVSMLVPPSYYANRLSSYFFDEDGVSIFTKIKCKIMNGMSWLANTIIKIPKKCFKQFKKTANWLGEKDTTTQYAYILLASFIIGFLKELFMIIWRGGPGGGQSPSGGSPGSKPKPRGGGQGFSSGDYKVSGKPGSARNIISKSLKNSKGNNSNNNSQGQMSDQEFETIRNLIFRNTFYIIAYREDDRCLRGRCLGIAGNTALLVDHYWEAWSNFSSESPTRFYVVRAAHQVALEFSLSEVQYQGFNDSSLGIIKLPSRFPMFKNITKQIAPAKMHDSVNGVGKIIEITLSEKLSAIPNIHNVLYSASPKLVAAGGTWFSDFETGELYEYDTFSGEGRCGSLLLATNLPHPIIGVHIAGVGDTGKGYSEVLCQEDFEFLFTELDVETKPTGNIESCKLVLDTQVCGLGNIGRKLRHHENEKSRIRPSFIQKFNNTNIEFKIFTEPSVLTPKDPRIAENPFSPMLEGSRFHGEPLVEIPSEILEIAYEDTKHQILTLVKPLRQNPTKLSKLNAAAGIPYLENYDCLEWRTSEGFPFVSMRPKGVHDKRWLFEFDSQGLCVGIKAMLLAQMKRDKNLRQQGIVPMTVFTNCLKDCTVAKEKVLQPGKTRIFSMAPVQFTLQQRQHTLDFSAAFMHHRIRSGHAIGINPDSVEWGRVFHYLGEISLTNIISADFSKFGDKLHYTIISKIVDLVEAWYERHGTVTQSMRNFYKSMKHEIGHAHHLMIDFVYQTMCGQPSGNSLTVIFNSIAGDMLIRSAWLTIMKPRGMDSMYEFHRNVRKLTYGDDVIISVSDEVREDFNGVTLQNYFKEMGLKFTSALKTDDIPKYASIWKSNFLKRGFAEHPTESRRKLGILLAPLEEASIEDTINWVWDNQLGAIEKHNPKYILMSKQICEDASRNAFTRGPKYYKEFTDKIKAFWAHQGEILNLMSWDELDRRVFDLQESLTEFYINKSIVFKTLGQTF